MYDLMRLAGVIGLFTPTNGVGPPKPRPSKIKLMFLRRN